MDTQKIGRFRVDAVVEVAGPTRPTWLLPAATPEALAPHRDWLVPHFLDGEGRLRQSVHAFVVRTPDLTVVVDTCIGNDKDRGGRRPFHMLRTGFLDTLKTAGVAPEAVDVVICTHLHVDHVGWNTRLDNGRWVPTFPRARYLFARREWEHWTAENEEGTRRIMGDSVAPVLDAGLVELVEMDHQVTDEIRLEPTPGHTPGHVSVRLASSGSDAVITGDLMHHPVQIGEPTWQTTFDTDAAAARETRRAFCARYGDQAVAVLGTHFHHPTAGRIVSHRDGWRFAVDGTK
jgi:glyoxylase-like metal-dependent hydrolase (beta-lactamase superfamily II)